MYVKKNVEAPGSLLASFGIVDAGFVTISAMAVVIPEVKVTTKNPWLTKRGH
jgi:hypothetical protein